MAPAKLQIISEEQLDATMNTKVLPYLASICTTGYMEVTPSQKIYYEMYLPEGAAGALVISHGFCESAEKYKEVIYYFVSINYQVYIMEHRGHGRSFRVTDHPNMVHIDSFSDYATDLHLFVENIVKPSANGLPLYLYAHSMGGAIGAMYLERWPDTFQKAILTAPMLELNMGSIPIFLAQFLSFIMVKTHHGNQYAIGQHAFLGNEKFEDSGSACKERFIYYQNKKNKEPAYQNSGSSYGWGYEAIHACHKIVSKHECSKITTPVLVFQSTNDFFVKGSGINRFVSHTANASLQLVQNSRHEIYNSSASVIEPYYESIRSFLQK